MSELPTRHHLRPSPLSPILYPLSPFFSHSSTLFCTILYTAKTQLFSFQSIPHSLHKTRGGGGGVDGETEDLMASLLNQIKIAYCQSSGCSLLHGPRETNRSSRLNSRPVPVVSTGGDSHAAELILAVPLVHDVP